MFIEKFKKHLYSIETRLEDSMGLDDFLRPRLNQIDFMSPKELLSHNLVNVFQT